MVRMSSKDDYKQKTMTDLKLSEFDKLIRNCYKEAKSAAITFELDNYGGYGFLPSNCKYIFLDTLLIGRSQHQ